MKQEIKVHPPFVSIFPVPVVLVTAIDKFSKVNLIPVAWIGVVNSEPPYIGISIRPQRYSNGLIKENRCFVINIPTEEMLCKLDYCGFNSGKDVDKFKKTGWQTKRAKSIDGYLIEECPVNLECRLKQTISLPSHDLFIGEILRTYVDEKLVKDKKANLSDLNPILMLYNEYFKLGEKLGEYGLSQK